MVKNPQPCGRSKVRIFFVDADLAPGDMQELTSAITIAIRPTHTPQRVTAPPRLSAAAVDGNGNGALEAHQAAEFEELNGESEEVAATPESRGPSKPRKYRSPKPVTDLDMSAGGKSFGAFAKEKGYNARPLLTSCERAASWVECASRRPILVHRVLAEAIA